MFKKIIRGEIYHVFNKSIANYGIYRDCNNSHRFIEVLDYYNNLAVTKSYSRFLRDNNYKEPANLIIPKDKAIVKFLSYCIMPDHYHLLIKSLTNFFFKFINDVENSFTRYFNLKFKRKGPLWQSDYKAVRIRTNEQLLHVSRYIHLNPVTNVLVLKPEQWQFSSYKQIIANHKILSRDLREISINTPWAYKKFVEDQIDYQKKLKIIRMLLFD